MVDSDAGERLYFVVETKGSTLPDDLRLDEAAKIECGREHFKALQTGDNPARYEVAENFDKLLAAIEGE